MADEGRRSLVSMYLPLAAQGIRVAYLPERLIGHLPRRWSRRWACSGK
ncbi:MAG: hypothetical protein U0R27_02220 [Candidatus Nanopelagicales bacterium]